MPEEKKEKSVRLPIEGARLRAWESMIAKKKILQQEALYAMIDWIVKQDDIVQSMVLGQIDPTVEIIELYIHKLHRDYKAQIATVERQKVNIRK